MLFFLFGAQTKEGQVMQHDWSKKQSDASVSLTPGLLVRLAHISELTLLFILHHPRLGIHSYLSEWF
jgi:hypothetical protein